MSSPLRRPLALALIGGGLVLALGVSVALRLLPEGRVGSLPDPARFAARFRELAQRQGVELAGEPQVRLLTGADDRRTVQRLLGEDADAWLARHGRGAQVEVSQAARWGAAQGRLEVTLSATGEAFRADWGPSSLVDFFSPRAAQPEGICGLLLSRGETLGGGTAPTGSFQAASTLTPIAAAEPAHLYRQDPAGGSLICTRRPGGVTAARADLDRHEFPYDWAAWLSILPQLALVAAAIVLFIVLAFRARIDLWNATLLAGTFFVTALLAGWPTTIPEAIGQALVLPLTSVWLLFLWSGSESWARARLPGFTGTLDTLRRGRLGARAGRELLAGWAAGAALAGARLLLLSLAASLPGLAPVAAAAELPLFGFSAHPLRHGMLWTGALLLVLTAALRLRTGAATVVTLLLMPLLVTAVGLAPWPAQYAAGLLLSGALLFVLRRAGVTAALVGSVLAFLLPAALFALRVASWVPWTAAAAALAAAAPLVAGFVGLARGEAVEHDPGAVPEFVRREERERRLTYEMDLLARMQLGLLPQSLPRLPGYEVTARSVLATEAGGDLYDFIRDERGRLWIAAGDVSGHGYSCAIAQASVKAALLSLVDGSITPARVLDRTDRVLRGSTGARQFATLCILCLEEASGRMLFANAGHPFPLLAAPPGPTREIEVPGLPLGQGPPRRYRDHEVVIPKGGVLLVYSDGLYEANDPQGVPYGFERPSKILSEAVAWNAAEILERLLFDWRRHLAGSAPADDTTLVVLKRV